jgi:superfamily II DNA or RNA helicase
MEIIIELSNRLTIRNASDTLKKQIKQRHTIENPLHLENKKMNRWNGKTDQYLYYYEITPSGIIVPRGSLPWVVTLLKQAGERFQIIDLRNILPEVNFQFQGNLKPFQQEAVDKMLFRDMGTLDAPTGSGKTVIALDLVAIRKQPTLIVVHTKELLNQWIERIHKFLGIPKDEIGIVGNGKKKIGKQITVALVQSLYKIALDVAPHIGFLIVDECHRTPSRTFTEAVSAFDCKYILGLSATPWRRDRLSKLIFWYVGNIIHEVDKENLVESGDVLQAEVIPRETGFNPLSDPSSEYTKMLSEVTQDYDRNRLIVGDIAKEAVNSGGIILVLSDRKTHCNTFQEMLAGRGIKSEVLTGDTPDNERKAIVESLNKKQVKVLVATGQLIGEGFDCKELSTLFLTTPIRFDGRVLQYLGRVLRPAQGKGKPKVYDYIDKNVGVLKAAAEARRRVYLG